ncbi:MAG: GGDEF domain-containing protein [Actinomycetia bacterium]|nr:GGDEF domain-containing protein [Actinomycetes bacterium]
MDNLLVLKILVFCMAGMLVLLLVGLLILWRQNQRHERQLFDMANRDFITGLPNRRYAFSFLFKRIGPAVPAEQRDTLVAFFIDLDNFEAVNDNLGHAAGDQLLKLIGQLLDTSMRETVGNSQRPFLTARLGGDEFLQLLATATLTEATDYAQRLLQNFSECPELTDHVRDFALGLSIGISIFPEQASDPDELVRHADIAMYHIKKLNKNGFKIYDPSWGESVEGASLTARQAAARR